MSPFEVFRFDLTRFDPTGENHKENIKYLQERGYAQLNQYQLKDEYNEDSPFCNGTALTRSAWNTMKKVNEIIKKYHWDKSEPMIDYFCTNFYYHLNIGRHDKSFQFTKNAPLSLKVTNLNFNGKRLDKRTANILAQILS